MDSVERIAVQARVGIREDPGDAGSSTRLARPAVPPGAVGPDPGPGAGDVDPPDLPRGVRGPGGSGGPRLGELVASHDRRPALAREAPPALLAGGGRGPL